MKGSRNYGSKKALLVTEDKLRYLEGFLSSKFDSVQYTAYCIDDTKLSPESFAELLQYENPLFKRITGLRIVESSEEQGAHLEVQLGVVGFHTGGDLVGFSFTYQDANWGIDVEKELLERLKEFHPWYWWLTSIKFWIALPVFFLASIYVLAYVMGGIVLFLKLHDSYPSISSQSSNEWVSPVVIFVIGSLLLIGAGFDRLIGYRFPRVFFCLGRQNEEYNKRKKVFGIILGTIIGGIIIGVLGNIVSAFIIK